MAVRLLRTLAAPIIQVKYCSTFDSTPEGNIGQSIDAALDEMNIPFTVALPALPVNGRTTYMGYHFVDRQLLSDSSMQNHPLNPMTNANLVTHLQTQTKRKVGLLAHPAVRLGLSNIQSSLEQLKADGVAIAILDCISEGDLKSLCDAIDGLPLITGSSAPAMYLPRTWTQRKPQLPARCPEGAGFLVVAGSMSEATTMQNRWMEREGARVFTIDALELAAGRTPSFAASIRDALLSRCTCLIETSREAARVKQYFANQAISGIEAGQRIALGLSMFVRDLLKQVTPEGIVIAGGETSSTLCRTLKLGALRVGPSIVPGVPACVSLNHPRLPLVLKSGNFGGEDFYARAIDALRALPFSQSD